MVVVSAAVGGRRDPFLGYQRREGGGDEQKDRVVGLLWSGFFFLRPRRRGRFGVLRACVKIG